MLTRQSIIVTQNITWAQRRDSSYWYMGAMFFFQSCQHKCWGKWKLPSCIFISPYIESSTVIIWSCLKYAFVAVWEVVICKRWGSRKTCKFSALCKFQTHGQILRETEVGCQLVGTYLVYMYIRDNNIYYFLSWYARRGSLFFPSIWVENTQNLKETVIRNDSKRVLSLQERFAILASE